MDNKSLFLMRSIGMVYTERPFFTGTYTNYAFALIIELLCTFGDGLMSSFTY